MVVELKFKDGEIWAIRDGKAGVVIEKELIDFYKIKDFESAVSFLKSTRPNLLHVTFVEAFTEPAGCWRAS